MMREASDTYIPEGYIQEQCNHGIYKLAKPLQIICTRCGAVIQEQEPFKLTEEEYQWLISLCCRSG